MKGICALAAAIILAACFNQPVLQTNAESYLFFARAETRYAYFYSSKTQSSALFTIPYTYCVQVISEDGDWYYVKYADDYGCYRSLYGYCLKDTLTAVNGVPSPVYLYKEVQVTYNADSSESSLPVLSELTVTAAFYGTFYSGPTAYSYVLCNGSFGYIEGANDDYELVDYAADDTADGTESDGDADSDEDGESSEGSGGNVIIAVVLIALAAATVIVLLLTGNRKKFG